MRAMEPRIASARTHILKHLAFAMEAALTDSLAVATTGNGQHSAGPQGGMHRRSSNGGSVGGSDAGGGRGGGLTSNGTARDGSNSGSINTSQAAVLHCAHAYAELGEAGPAEVCVCVCVCVCLHAGGCGWKAGSTLCHALQ